MSKKMIASIILIAAGVLSGLFIIFTYSMSGGNTIITMWLLFFAILCIIFGSLLAFSRLLDRSITPLVEDIHADIKDDIRDLKARQFTNTHLMVLFVALAAITFSFFAFRFHKLEATWGGIPVVIPTFIALLGLAWFVPNTSWFQSYRDHTPLWVFLVPTIGFVVSLWLGLAKTENMGLLRAPTTDTMSYNTIQTTGFLLNTGSNMGFSMDLPDCDGEACVVGLLVVVLIVLTLVLVIGSAMIPHFWILSCSILLGVMILIAIHDLRLRPATQGAQAAHT